MGQRRRETRGAAGDGVTVGHGAPNGGAPEQGRFSSRRKMDAILGLLRGEDLDALSRKLGVTAATIAHWRGTFLAGGQGALKSWSADERDAEIQRLRAKIGEITMANELLLERSRAAEARLPLARRRRRA